MKTSPKGHTRVWVGRAIVALLLACATSVPAQPDSTASATREYRVKAAFLYHFISFVDGWRFKQKGQDNETPIQIGIIGLDPFKDAFEPLKDKRARGRAIVVKYFKGCSELDDQQRDVDPHPDIEAIKNCDLLFVCSSEKRHITQILDSVRTEPILTIADTPGFIEAGGVINFLAEKGNIRFEINTAGARRAKLIIRSKLLRLAKRVIDEDKLGSK